MKESTGKDAARFRARTHLEQGRHLFNARRFDQALASFEKAIESDPTLTRAYTAKAHTLVMTGRAREALILLDDLIRREPDFPLTHTTRGTALHALDRAGEAREAYERAAELAPADPLVHYNFACYWSLIGDEGRCREHLTLAIRFDPQSNSTAAVDDDFERYRDRAWFQELVAFKR